MNDEICTGEIKITNFNIIAFLLRSNDIYVFIMYIYVNMASLAKSDNIISPSYLNIMLTWTLWKLTF